MADGSERRHRRRRPVHEDAELRIVEPCGKRPGHGDDVTLSPVPHRRRELQEITGSPIVPPPRMTKALLAGRRGALRAHRSSAPPPIRVMEAMFGLYDNRVLGLLVELDVPEHLRSPLTVEELATRTGSKSDALDRVLRY